MWVAVKLGPKTYGVGRSGGPVEIEVRPTSGGENADEFKAAVVAMLDGLNAPAKTRPLKKGVGQRVFR